MPNTREKLIELCRTACTPANCKPGKGDKRCYECLADHLIDNGVTVAYNLSPTEPPTNCQQWIPVTERFPVNFVSVLGYMTDAGEFPPVRECYTVGNAFFFPALGDIHPVSHWMPLPEPPKEE